MKAYSFEKHDFVMDLEDISYAFADGRYLVIIFKSKKDSFSISFGSEKEAAEGFQTLAEAMYDESN